MLGRIGGAATLVPPEVPGMIDGSEELFQQVAMAVRAWKQQPL